MSTRRILLSVVLVGLLAETASGQDSLQGAKDLYASAAYEDALAVLSRLQRSDAPVEVQQYRAFCLIALGRITEAEQAIEFVVAANPRYVPSTMDVSPRIQEVFARTRKQILPDIARQAYSDAKRALDRKDREAAVSGFGSVVDLIDGSDAETREALDELRFLAAGFSDLSRALGAPPENAPAASAAATSTAPVAAPLDIGPPVAIRQILPPWIPSDSARQSIFTGAIRVSISDRGRVEAAEMVRPVHPAYDRLLLQAAKAWEYQPARRGGAPVPSEQVIEVQLKPKQ